MKRRPIASLARQVRRSVWSIAAILSVPVMISLAVMFLYGTYYHGSITRMNRAADLKPRVETEIPEQLFAVTAGRVSYEDSQVEEILDTVTQTLDQLLRETSGDGQLQLTVARRTMSTLSGYAQQIREGMADRQSITSLVMVVDEVRSVGTLIGDMLDAFISTEIAGAAESNQRLQTVLIISAAVEAGLLILSLWRARNASRRLTGSIDTAIGDLESIVRRLAGGNLQERITGMDVQELQELAEQINIMADRLDTLIVQIKQEQLNLAKSEMRTLQAQIHPHFLYNTLDTIIWQAESGKADEVIQLTRSLSDFFRISLSAGQDWIPVKQEIQHVTAYLRIQKTRYRDILTYEVDVGNGLEDLWMVKLLLQPLVENALYHGIRAKRGGGRIAITVRREEDRIRFTVTDNGKGMDAETLARVQASLKAEAGPLPSRQDSGFGLKNVDLRIRLYYEQAEGLEIASGSDGTRISFSVPCRTREDTQHDEGLSDR